MGESLNEKMILFFVIPFIHVIQPLATFLLEKFSKNGATRQLIEEIDAQLKGMGQQEDFTQWARLTRKKQALEKMAKNEAEQSAKNAQNGINGVVKVMTIGLMVMYRSAELLTLDSELLPVPLVKMASFTGFSFVTYGNVSGFAWFYISKSVINMLVSQFSSVIPSKQASGGLPDIMNLLQPPKLD